MIDFELAFINTEHPDFANLKKGLLPLITKALGVESTLQEISHEKKMKSPSPVRMAEMSPMPSEGTVYHRESEECSPQPGPFWKNWWSEHDSNQSSLQPKPRRGGRRSSFSIMDASELQAFRQSQFESAEPSSPSHSHTNNASRSSESKNTGVELVKEMIKAYFSIVARDITDKVHRTYIFSIN